MCNVRPFLDSVCDVLLQMPRVLARDLWGRRLRSVKAKWAFHRFLSRKDCCLRSQSLLRKGLAERCVASEKLLVPTTVTVVLGVAAVAVPPRIATPGAAACAITGGGGGAITDHVVHGESTTLRPVCATVALGVLTLPLEALRFALGVGLLLGLRDDLDGRLEVHAVVFRQLERFSTAGAAGEALESVADVRHDLDRFAVTVLLLDVHRLAVFEDDFASFVELLHRQRVLVDHGLEHGEAELAGGRHEIAPLAVFALLAALDVLDALVLDDLASAQLVGEGTELFPTRFVGFELGLGGADVSKARGQAVFRVAVASELRQAGVGDQILFAQQLLTQLRLQHAQWGNAQFLRRDKDGLRAHRALVFRHGDGIGLLFDLDGLRGDFDFHDLAAFARRTLLLRDGLDEDGRGSFGLEHGNFDHGLILRIHGNS